MSKDLVQKIIQSKHKDQVPGGRADKRQPREFPLSELRKGIKVELEHTNKKSLAKEIAMDHLTEDKKYYTKLIKMEKSAKDSITQDAGFAYQPKAFSQSLKIGKDNNIDPRLAEQNARMTSRLASANARQNNLVFPMLSTNLGTADPVNKADKQTDRIVKDASEVAATDLHHFQTWKTDPSPENLSTLMTRFDPIIHKEVNKYSQSGLNPVILKAKARDFTYQALQSYNPKKNVQLNTHVTNSLKQMSRFAINNQNAIRVPEEQIYGYRHYLKTKEQMEQEMGREPTHLEVKERLNEQGKQVKNFKPIVEHFYSRSSEDNTAPVMEELSSNVTAMSIMFDRLDDTEKFIFKHSYGYQGAPQKSNLEIARELGVSPAAVSKRKNTIEKKYKSIASPLQNFMGA